MPCLVCSSSRGHAGPITCQAATVDIGKHATTCNSSLAIKNVQRECPTSQAPGWPRGGEALSCCSCMCRPGTRQATAPGCLHSNSEWSAIGTAWPAFSSRLLLVFSPSQPPTLRIYTQLWLLSLLLLGASCSFPNSPSASPSSSSPAPCGLS